MFKTHVGKGEVGFYKKKKTLKSGGFITIKDMFKTHVGKG